MLKPIFDELIPVAEETTIRKISSKAAEARLSSDLVKEIEADAKWNPVAKKGLALSAPEVTAEALNAMGISAKNKSRVVLISSLTAIIAGYAKVTQRLDKLIALANPPKPPAAPAPAPEKKP